MRLFELEVLPEGPLRFWRWRLGPASGSTEMQGYGDAFHQNICGVLRVPKDGSRVFYTRSGQGEHDFESSSLL